MKLPFIVVIALLALPGAAFAGTKTYSLQPFTGVAVSAGIAADIKIGQPQSVVAETGGTNFDDLEVAATNGVLRIGRPPMSWLYRLGHPDYLVHVTVPALGALAASSGGSAKVDGAVAGDFSIAASSSGRAEVLSLKGGNVIAHASSGGSAELSGSCDTLNVSASSGGNVVASALQCETVMANASSGGGVTAFASKSVTGHASSGGGISISGKPPLVQVNQSSGGSINVAR